MVMCGSAIRTVQRMAGGMEQRGINLNCIEIRDRLRRSRRADGLARTIQCFFFTRSPATDSDDSHPQRIFGNDCQRGRSQSIISSSGLPSIPHRSTSASHSVPYKGTSGGARSDASDGSRRSISHGDSECPAHISDSECPARIRRLGNLRPISGELNLNHDRGS
jgi:hypothetical protein